MSLSSLFSSRHSTSLPSRPSLPAPCVPPSAAGQDVDPIGEGAEADEDGETRDPGGFEKPIMSREPRSAVDERSQEDESLGDQVDPILILPASSGYP
jgi:hypothetical protein